MPLTRQVWLLLLLTLLVALLGSVAVSVFSARSYMQIQLQQKNRDNASTLALALSQQRGDRALIDSLLVAQFDSGAYEQIRFVAADGSRPFVRLREHATRAAPDWFVRWVAIAPVPGAAQVSDGRRPLGTVEVASSVAFAHDELWRGSLQTAAALAGVGLVAGLVASLAVLRIRRPLAAAVEQANALVDGRFLTVTEPPVRELRTLTRAMNSMVARLKATFDLQAVQLEQLRRQAQCDALTGLSNRSQFLGQLEAALVREDGVERSGLVLLRLRDLATVNLALGHAATDRLLGAIAEALRPYSQRVKGCFLGRLNGADFALCLPVGGLAQETAEALAAALRAVLPTLGPGVGVAIGAVELRRETPLAHALAAADTALARAEARGPFAVEIGVDGDGKPDLGEGAWRRSIADALAADRVQLAEFGLIDAAGELVHLECPLRLQLAPDGPFEVAARWLPLAVRARLTTAIDARAVALALQGVARDGRPRCVNLSPASLADSAFAPGLRGLLFAAPRAARKLSLEVAEAAAVEQFGLVQELARQLRPCGVRLGLEHAGTRLGQIDRLFEAGLDFVKLDASATHGVGSDPQRATFVRGLVELLHRLTLQVYAEGVTDADDARALWACGLDGLTGPWASQQRGGGV